MNLGGLLAATRRRLDDEVLPGLWEDDELIGFLNEAVKEAVIRLRALLEARNPRVCTAQITAGSSDIKRHPAVLAIRSARLASTGRPLELVELKVLDRDRPQWPLDEGAPTHIVIDRQSGQLTLYPRPTADDTLQLAVWRAPLEAERLESEGDEPPIDELWHEGLIDWAEHLAYLRADSETFDQQRSDRAEARFTALFGKRPTAARIAAWGLTAKRGTRPEFL